MHGSWHYEMSKMKRRIMITDRIHLAEPGLLEKYMGKLFQIKRIKR